MKSDTRRYDIDVLRVLATLLLIVFHTGMVFTAYDGWHIQNLERSALVGEFLSFIHTWHMPLFFLLAGASTYLALNFRSSGEYARERVKRLLFPLIVGMLVVIPPQLYVERIATWVPTRLSPINFSGSFWQWYPNTFQCCYTDGNLSYHHLWFVGYLFIYSLLLLPLLVYLRRPAGRAHLQRLTTFLARGRNILLPALAISLVEMSLRWRFPNWQDFIHDWANNVHYPLVFLLGFILMSDSRLTAATVRQRRLALLVASIAMFARSGESSSVVGFLIDSFFRGIAEWGFLVAMLGYGYQYLNRPSKLLRHSSEIAYPFYIWHQTVIVVLAYFVVQWEASIGVKFLAISSAALIGTWLICEAIKLTNVTRVMFGLKARRKAAKAKQARLPQTA